VRLKQPAKAWALLKHTPDPRARSYLIHRLNPLGAEARVIVNRLDSEPDVTIRRALLLSLGEYGEKEFPPAARKAALSKLQELYRTAPDPGLHAAVEWLLRQWKQQAWLKQCNEAWAKNKEQQTKRLEGIRRALAKKKEKGQPQWYVNGQGQTIVVIPGPVTFVMGSPATELERSADEVQHSKRIGRTFALAAKLVTVEQYRCFNKSYQIPPLYTRMAELPVTHLSWHQAAAYCNWLSKEEGIDEGQWCYEIKNKQVTQLKANYLGLTGYRLPTEAEIEYATRAGTVTSRYFGETVELLPKYSWYVKNSEQKTWPVGSLKPNDFGMFDMPGNVFAWCQERYKSYPRGQGEELEEDKEDICSINNLETRVYRGGAFYVREATCRSAKRDETGPTTRFPGIGFRVARTFAR
jgi:formylglycine-generating enzyme required for sulfatase activity